MKNYAIILLCLFIGATSFYIGGLKAPKEMTQDFAQYEVLVNQKDIENKLTKLLNTKNKSIEEVSEKLFLLLVSELGLNSLTKKYRTLITSLNKNNAPKEIIKEIEIVKECPQERTQFSKNQEENDEKNNKEIQKERLEKYKEPRTSFNSPELFKSPDSMTKLYNESYALVRPFELWKGKKSFRILNSSSRDHTGLEIDLGLNFKQKFWQGKITAELNGHDDKALAKLENKGVNKSLLEAPTNPPSLILDMDEYIVHLLHTGKRFNSGTLYKKIKEGPHGKSFIELGKIREDLSLNAVE